MKIKIIVLVWKKSLIKKHGSENAAIRHYTKSNSIISNSLVRYFIFPLIFHLERKFVLFKHSHGSKVQQAICNRIRVHGVNL